MKSAIWTYMGIVFMVAIIGFAVYGAVSVGRIVKNDKPHRCYAPCIVVLQPETLEDEFWFDYGWETDERSIVTIYSCNHQRVAALARACDRRPD